MDNYFMLTAHLTKTIGNPCGACALAIAIGTPQDSATAGDRISSESPIMPENALVALELNVHEALRDVVVTALRIELRDALGRTFYSANLAGEHYAGSSEVLDIISADQGEAFPEIGSYRLAWTCKGAQGTATFFADSAVHTAEANSHRKIA